MSDLPAKNGYDVGYGRPPIERQFGQPNGNPTTIGGQPKGTRHVKKRLNNALKRYIRDHPGCEYEIAGALVEEARTRPRTIIEQEGNKKTIEQVGACWPQAQKLLWDRRDGLLSQKHEVEIKSPMRRVIVLGATPPPEIMP